MNALRFEWDEKKDAANRRKHGISFEEAASVLVVCHCYRQSDEVIRIISARKADRDETEQYHWWMK